MMICETRLERGQIVRVLWLLGLSLLLCEVALSHRLTWARPRVNLRPPLWLDADSNPVPKPKVKEVSELYAILNNSFFRPLDVTSKTVSSLENGALNVNAWDEVPDSSWFNNRIGRRPLSFEEILAGLEGKAPDPGSWKILRIRDEGYTPKVDIQDASGTRYVLKFDLPEKAERNSGAERICTLIMHAMGYNVPYNTIVYFGPDDLRPDEDSYYRDALARRRPMTPDDLQALLKRLPVRPDGRYRGMASLMLPGQPLGPFLYTGRRKDDPNDIIPHELRRELRGMRVIASWINHADVKDVNALDVYVQGNSGGGHVKHYLLDFGSTMGSGDFIHGPYRIGHEYIYDGAATGRSFITLGAWMRPWEARGKIVHPEIGYYQAELFDPGQWKPNYPNLAFARMDDSDAYWGAKLVTAFSDELVDRLAEAGQYSRPEVTEHLKSVLKQRRDAIGNYWFDRITPLEDPALVHGEAGYRLRVRDLSLERGYAEEESRTYRLQVLDPEGKVRVRPAETRIRGNLLEVPGIAQDPAKPGVPDKYGRRPVLRILVESKRQKDGWARPIEIVLGFRPNSSSLAVLGWTHAPK